MNSKKNQILVSILGIMSLLLITIGVTYAIFTYTRLGTTDNTITTGTLKFLYTENSKGGTGISITEAFPISDTEGKILTGDNNVFDFKVEGTNTGTDEIPYEITLRKKDTSTLAESNIKVYLTDMEGDADTEILAPTLYSSLTQTNVDVGDEVEKTLYTGSVLGNTANYLKEFRLRMWVDEASNQDDINGKTFTATVNVYANTEIVEETKTLLKDEIMKNTLIEATPTLTTSSNNTSDASGLYKSTATNSGEPTYYFRGNVENNYVSFAGFTWRVVRINEDGTIRMIMANGINDDATYAFNSTYSDYTYMYYTNSNAKEQLETWYTNNIANNTNYASKVVAGDYFCEQAKVKYSSSLTSGSATMEVYSSYAPNFKCEADGNGKGLVNASIGLITYDEEVFAGGYFNKSNNNYYLYNNTDYWTMNPSGVNTSTYADAWCILSNGILYSNNVGIKYRLRAVLILNADVTVTGSGTSTDPWVVV